jgi:hypothetical protein
MGIEDFIQEALLKPNDYIAYHVGRELAELHPGRTIVEGETWYFNLEEYVRAEKCSIVHELSLFNHIKTDWMGPNRKLKDTAQNSWLNVLWKGQLLDVVLITWTEDRCRTRHHWIVAESRTIAEEFFKDVCDWNAEVRGELLIFQDGDWTKSKTLYRAIQSATFDNLIMRDSLKREIKDDFERFFSSREVYERYQIPWKRGVLFIGPPGNGKTHMVKALINHLKQPCLYVKSFKSDYETPQENISQVFKRARHTTPCLVVLEDLDSMIDDKNRSFFLNELDGFETNTGVVVLATTNHPERLDPAILDRPSRFDRKYQFDLPGMEERQRYIAEWGTKLQAELSLSEKKIAKLARQTEGFSYAYLKELFLSSLMQWMALSGGTPIGRIILDQAKLLRPQKKQG